MTLIAGLILAPLAAAPALAAQAMDKDSAAMSKDGMGKDGMNHGAMDQHGAMEGMEAKGIAPKMLKGTFAGAEGHDAEGSFQFVTEGEETRISLGRDFKVDRGPDVYLVLSRAPKVAAEGDLYLGKLTKFKGEQVFDVPPGTDLGQYQHLVLWCRKYSVAMGAAELAPGGEAMH
jgi:hypothetical protein